jgi:DNA-binding NarL/FixJ family response regulator
MTAPYPDTPRLKVMLVDDHALVAAGYERLLQWEPDLHVVATHATADAAYAQLCAQPGVADVMLLDLSMPGRSGFDLLRRVRLRCPWLRVLVCSMHDAPAMVARAFEAGAQGYVSKSSDPALLADALRRVHAGEHVLSPDLSEALEEPSAQAPHLVLTAREFDVFVRLARGDSVEVIAAALSVAPKTAANLQTIVRQKLGVDSAMGLLQLARKHHLVPD